MNLLSRRINNNHEELITISLENNSSKKEAAPAAQKRAAIEDGLKKGATFLKGYEYIKAGITLCLKEWSHTFGSERALLSHTTKKRIGTIPTCMVGGKP